MVARLKRDALPEGRQVKRSHFEHAASRRITTIAPTPADGKSLKAHGWVFVVRDSDGHEIERRDPDEVRAAMWLSMGHQVGGDK